ncbi:MAG: hypothetical protein JW751_07905 [Polyangiaceae bacterium]|nr:hypothetical protein [Polyangiaceae bacterium]
MKSGCIHDWHWLLVAAAGAVACGGGDNVSSTDPATGGSGTGGSGAGASATGGDGSVEDGTETVAPAAACPATTQPCTPTLLTGGMPGPGAFQERDGYLYWRNVGPSGLGPDLNPSSILRLMLPGGTPEILADVSPARPAAVHVDATHVYFSVMESGVGRVPLTGGQVEYLTDDAPFMIAVDDTDVYYSMVEGQGDGVWRVPKDGGDPAMVAEAPARALIAIDRGFIYWTVPATTDAQILVRVPKTGGATETLSNVVPIDLERLLVFGGFVHAVITVPLPTIGPRGLLERYPAGGGAEVELATFPDPIASIAVDGDSLYLGTCPGVEGAATVEKISHDGSARTTIATGGICYSGMAVDATNVYFAEWGRANYSYLGDCSVLTAPKCGCE